MPVIGHASAYAAFELHLVVQPATIHLISSDAMNRLRCLGNPIDKPANGHLVDLKQGDPATVL